MFDPHFETNPPPLEPRTSRPPTGSSGVLARPGLIAVVTLISILLSGTAAALIPPVYRAVALVTFDPRASGKRGGAASNPDIASDSAAADTEVEIFRSAAIARDVVRRTGFITPEKPGIAFEGRLPLSLANAGNFFGLNRIAPAPRTESASSETAAMEALQKRTDIGRAGKSYVITVAVDMPSAEEAAKVANAYTAAYLAAREAAQREAAHNIRALFEQRVTELRTQVETAELEVERFRLAKLNPGTDATTAKVTLQNLESAARAYRVHYDRFLADSAEAHETSAMFIPRAYVVSAALPPSRKHWPSTTLFLAAGIILGLASGMAVSLALGPRKTAS